MGVSLLSNALVLLCLLHSADIRRQAPALFTLNLTCGNLLCTVVNMPLTLAGVVAQRPPAGSMPLRVVPSSTGLLRSLSPQQRNIRSWTQA